MNNRGTSFVRMNLFGVISVHTSNKPGMKIHKRVYKKWLIEKGGTPPDTCLQTDSMGTLEKTEKLELSASIVAFK